MAIPLLIVFLVILTPQTSQTAPTSVTEQIKLATPMEILELVNKERLKVGAKPLVVSDILTQSAQERADDMTTRNYYSHYDPITGIAKIDEQDTGCVQTENLNNGQLSHSAEQTVESWLGSETHKKAMLEKEFTITGIAINGDYIVEHFCK